MELFHGGLNNDEKKEHFSITCKYKELEVPCKFIKIGSHYCIYIVIFIIIIAIMKFLYLRGARTSTSAFGIVLMCVF
jgi:hypothetical protein